MNAIDFGYTSDRDHTRGICQWVSDKEWCGTPLVVENYRGSFNPPTNYKYGALYGIEIPHGLPTSESMWICPSHRFQFLFANGIKDVTIWEFQHNGMGVKVSPRVVRHECDDCKGHLEPIRTGELNEE